MKRPFALLLSLAVAALTSPAGAQPDKTEALAKAKAKFETDVAKAEDAFLASIDKTIKSAGGNKALAEKLAYERDLFVREKLISTAAPAGAYLTQRSRATAALEAAYLSGIKDFVKAKKEEEAEALENVLGGLLKTARGYGLGLPDLVARPLVTIENKATGFVMEPSGADGSGDVVLVKKVAKRKLQCWYLDRDEKGYTLVNAQTGRACFVSIRDGDAPATLLATNKIDPTKEVPDRFHFRFAEFRRETVITSFSKGDRNGYILTANERKQKGVSIPEPTLEKPDGMTNTHQRWLVTEAK